MSWADAMPDDAGSRAGGPFPEHLTAWWDSLSDLERSHFNGRKWRRSDLIHTVAVAMCFEVVRRSGLALEDALALCCFADGLGCDPLHERLMLEAWKVRDASEAAAVAAEKKAADRRAHFLVITDEPWEPDMIGPRPWLAKPYLMRGEITLLHGPGGGGKSQLAIHWAVALALGRPFGRLDPIARSRVLLTNFEDNAKEQMRRISAALQFFDAKPADLKGWLYRVCVGPNGDATMFDLDETGSVHTTECWDALIYACEQIKPDAVFLDPLVAINAVTENSNQLMRRVMVLQRAGIAQHFDCALAELHHDNKSGNDHEDADQTNVRGGGDIVNAVRFELAVKKLSSEQANEMGVQADRRGYYFRLGSAASKLNYAAPEESEWFERFAVVINGEEVVRCVPWQAVGSKVSADIADAIVAAVEKGTTSGPYSPQLGNTDRSIAQVLEGLGIATALAQRRVLRELLRLGRIAKAQWKVNDGERHRSGLRSAAGLPYNYEWQELADTE